MRIRPFDYYAATNLNDALERLEHYGRDARILAGGTDLVLAMKEGKTAPAHVVSLHRLKELDYVNREGSVIRIGSLAKHADLAVAPILKDNLPILCEAVRLIGSWQVRNVATIGGNLCTASPAADSAPPLLALGARAVIADRMGDRELDLGSFFKGPGETVLGPTELLKEIIIPCSKNSSAGCFLKLMRKKAVDLALVNVAFYAETDPSMSKLAQVAIAMGGVAPTPIRAPEAEASLLNLSYPEALEKILGAARLAMEATRPITDTRASADYRRIVVETFVRRAGEKTLNTLFKREGR